MRVQENSPLLFFSPAASLAHYRVNSSVVTLYCFGTWLVCEQGGSKLSLHLLTDVKSEEHIRQNISKHFRCSWFYISSHIITDIQLHVGAQRHESYWHTTDKHSGDFQTVNVWEDVLRELSLDCPLVVKLHTTCWNHSAAPLRQYIFKSTVHHYRLCIVYASQSLSNNMKCNTSTTLSLIIHLPTGNWTSNRLASIIKLTGKQTTQKFNYMFTSSKYKCYFKIQDKTTQWNQDVSQTNGLVSEQLSFCPHAFLLLQ